jgi:hypothetical protein
MTLGEKAVIRLYQFSEGQQSLVQLWTCTHKYFLQLLLHICVNCLKLALCTSSLENVHTGSESARAITHVIIT